MKVVNVHSFSHFSDNENAVEKCQFCEFYNAVEDTADFSPTLEIPKDTQIVQNLEYTETYALNTRSSIIYSGIYYNLPPPVLM